MGTTTNRSALRKYALEQIGLSPENEGIFWRIVVVEIPS
jgi:hypothetical protein